MTATRRDPMLAAGEDLFLRSGFAAVGLRDILTAVSASKGAFYHFFPSKKAFAVAVLDRHLTQRTTEMAALFAQHPGMTGILRGFEDDVLTMEASGFVPPCLARRLAADLGAGMPVDPVRSALDTMASTLANALSQAQSEGSVYADFDATAAAHHLLDLWHGATTRASVERSSAPLREALDHFAVWLKP